MSKFVLVRSRLGTLFVLPRRDWETYSAQAIALGEKASELVLESDDYDKLRRFRDLTKEET